MSRKETSNRTTPIIIGSVLLVLFVAFIFVLKYIDVAAIGPGATKVGLATINGMFADFVGFNNIFYKLTQLLGYLAILIFIFFAVCGVLQLIKRRSLFKVDRGLITMGIMFVILLILYIAFDKLAINFRPVLMAGETMPEPSFPSSHTMLAVCVFGATIIEFRHRLKEGRSYNIIKVMMICLIVVTVAGRLLSGAHWLTDIIGGLLISGSLISFFAAASQE
ncbi:MAG: phosphatase PAP2 family protein [Lachnospiraceae bacterium]|jgi:undecaprenyl-diphosphatase|nr:phosphatase PAP2 family protein [Lachnospiraceae bacterium]